MFKALTTSVSACFVSLALATASAQAVTIQMINFDDVNTGGPGGYTELQNGYAGLNWDNFFALNPNANYTTTGYYNNIVSQPNVAFNGYGSPASFSSNTPFSLYGGYFGSAWYNQTITAVGLLNGVQEDTKTFNVNTQSPQLIAFNWSGINEVDFTSSNYQFALDNLEIAENQVTAMPLPGSMVMFLTALMGLAGLTWHRKRRTMCNRMS